MSSTLCQTDNEEMSEIEIRHRADRREMAMINRQIALEAAWQEGFEIGLAKAREAAIQRGMEVALSRVIASGIPEAQARAWLDM